MSRNYIEIEQNVFRNEILKKLNKEELQAKGYKTIIQNNYTFNRVESKYTLNDNLAEPVLKHCKYLKLLDSAIADTEEIEYKRMP